MSEDNALEEAFNFLDEEDDDSDEEGEEWEDQTSSTSQLTKVEGGHTHTRTFLGSVPSPCLFTPSEHESQGFQCEMLPLPVHLCNHSLAMRCIF